MGRKAKPKCLPREPLQIRPPRELNLNPDVAKIYKQLATRLRAEGWVCQADQWMIAEAAESIYMVQKLKKQLELETDNHKLRRELRAERASMATQLDRLFLNPRARARGSSRIGESALRQCNEDLMTDDEFFKD